MLKTRRMNALSSPVGRRVKRYEDHQGVQQEAQGCAASSAIRLLSAEGAARRWCRRRGFGERGSCEHGRFVRLIQLVRLISLSGPGRHRVRPFRSAVQHCRQRCDGVVDGSDRPAR